MGGLLRFWFRHGGVRSAARKVAIVFVVKWQCGFGGHASGGPTSFRPAPRVSPSGFRKACFTSASCTPIRRTEVALKKTGSMLQDMLNSLTYFGC